LELYMKLRYPVAKHILPHHAVNFLGCTRQIGQTHVSANSCPLSRSVCGVNTLKMERGILGKDG